MLTPEELAAFERERRKSGYEINLEREKTYKDECIAGGRECLTPREAARLFDVSASTVRQAAREGKIRPVFTFTVGKGVPMYRLQDLVDYMADRAAPDPVVLADQREKGVTCFMPFGSPGGWLLIGDVTKGDSE